MAVNTRYQGQGYGRGLMGFALSNMQKSGVSPVKLSVTKWNSRAVALYESLGFVITKEKTVGGVNTKDADGNWVFEFTAVEGLNIR